jgi:hypothetical protein
MPLFILTRSITRSISGLSGGAASGAGSSGTVRGCSGGAACGGGLSTGADAGGTVSGNAEDRPCPASGLSAAVSLLRTVTPTVQEIIKIPITTHAIIALTIVPRVQKNKKRNMPLISITILCNKLTRITILIKLLFHYSIDII